MTITCRCYGGQLEVATLGGHHDHWWCTMMTKLKMLSVTLIFQAGADTSLEDNEGRTAGVLFLSCLIFYKIFFPWYTTHDYIALNKSYLLNQGMVAETYKHLPVADCINSPRWWKKEQRKSQLLTYLLFHRNRHDSFHISPIWHSAFHLTSML